MSDQGIKVHFKFRLSNPDLFLLTFFELYLSQACLKHSTIYRNAFYIL